LKNFIHPFLFATFPILSLFSYNIGIIPVERLFIILGIVFLCVLILIIALKFIFNKSHKTSLILSIGIISFFFYGHLFNLISEFNPEQYLHQRFVVIPYLVFFILPTIFLIKTKKKLDNTNKIATSISIIFIIISISNITINSTFSEEPVTTSLINKNLEIAEKPDIYYLIFDAYADNYTLNHHFEYDNSDFNDYLIQKGFQSNTPSYSNYHTTYLSLSSSLNLNYVNELLDEKNSSFDVISANRLIDKNTLMKTMRENGYVNINFDSGWGPTRNISVADMNLCGQKSFLFSEFLISISETSMLKPFYAVFFQSDHRERILCVLSEIPTISKDIEKPIFVFAHLLLPHPPYVFDQFGNPTTVESLQFSSNKITNEKELYLDQLKFTNLKIKEIIEILTSENAIIIIQSDHGPPDSIFALKNDDSTDKDKLRNINYYYFPDNKKIIYDGITPVNSFRIIFKNYLSNEIEILPDRNFYINEKVDQFKLIEITNELSR
jgi:hypothetical protein